jgi:hypothetical protein
MGAVPPRRPSRGLPRCAAGAKLGIVGGGPGRLPPGRTLSEPVSDHGGAHSVELEDRRVTILDNHSSTPQGSKLAECIAQLAVDHAGHQIGQGLALDSSNELTGDLDAVVTAGEDRDYEGATQLADLGAHTAAETKLGIKIDRLTPEQVSGVASEQPDQQLPDDAQDSSTGANGPGSGQ